MVSDGKPGGRVQAELLFRVIRPNSPPVSYPMPGAFSTTGQVFKADLSIFFADKDRDLLSFSLATTLPGLTMGSTTGILEGIPSGVLLGTYAISFGKFFLKFYWHHEISL